MTTNTNDALPYATSALLRGVTSALRKWPTVRDDHIALYDLFTAEIFDSSVLLACLIKRGATSPFHFKYTTDDDREAGIGSYNGVFLFF